MNIIEEEMKSYIVEFRCNRNQDHTIRLNAESGDPVLIKYLVEKKYRKYKPVEIHKITKETPNDIRTK